MLKRFHPLRLPPRPFSGPRGVHPRSPLQPCFMLLTLLGFHPTGSSPLHWPHRVHHPAAPLSAFLLLQSSPAEARSAVQAAPPGAYAQRRVRARGLECCIQSGVDTLVGFVVAGHPSPASPPFQSGSGPDSRYLLRRQALCTANAFRMRRVCRRSSPVPFEGFSSLVGWCPATLSRVPLRLTASRGVCRPALPLTAAPSEALRGAGPDSQQAALPGLLP